MKKHLLIIGIIFLFFISAVAPITLGYNIRLLNKVETHTPEPLDNPPIDSPWPMHGHDVRHTGRSPYSTASNPGIEKWRFTTSMGVDGSAVIDENGTIYFGTNDGFFYALYPDGTQKWKVVLSWGICEFGSSPAIDESGVIYVPTRHGGLYAVNPDGTIKWKHSDADVKTSPIIGDDGTIYFCVDSGKFIRALYPNGTEKWTFTPGDFIQSSPAIGQDGTVYFGSHNTYLYALYPDNGTLKWKFKTGNWIHGSPSIGDDGTVYIGSDDGYLYALHPNNGTMKWKRSVGSMRCSPSIDKNGILYFGVWQGRFYAVYPEGTIKWSFDLGERNGMWGSSAAISDDGTIYFGTCIGIFYDKGGDIIALNPDGTEKWRSRITSFRVTSSPCIGPDGTVYIGSYWAYDSYLHAFGELDSNAPYAPDIDGPPSGNYGIDYEYTFKSTSPLGRDVYYYIDWGDGAVKDWFGPYASGEEVTASHKWSEEGTFTIRARAKDTENLWGPWGELQVTMPRNKTTNNQLLILRLLDRFPLLQKLLFSL